ncbi:hypothetical protein RUND412_010336 [Rhizina undulata]
MLNFLLIFAVPLLIMFSLTGDLHLPSNTLVVSLIEKQKLHQHSAMLLSSLHCGLARLMEFLLARREQKEFMEKYDVWVKMQRERTGGY